MVNIASFYEGEADRPSRAGVGRATSRPQLLQDDHGVYVNFLVDEGEDADPGGLSRPRPGIAWSTIKRRYDPDERLPPQPERPAGGRLMGTVVYSMMVSLDGFVSTPDGSLDWVIIEEEIHRFANAEQARVAVSVYGRGMWETMSLLVDCRPEPGRAAGPGGVREDLAGEPEGRRVAEPRGRGGPERPARSRRRCRRGPPAGGRDGRRGLGRRGDARGVADPAGLVDELRLYTHPVAIGAGKPYLPSGTPRQSLELVDTHDFATGVTYRAYRRRP